METNNHWNRFATYDFSLPPKQRPLCPHAADFDTWVQTEYRELERADRITVNQLKIWTTDKYFEYVTRVDKSHKEHASSRGHRCIYHVFREAYKRLLDREAHLTPPLLFEPPRSLPPPAPPPEPVIQISGVTLGEFIDR